VRGAAYLKIARSSDYRIAADTAAATENVFGGPPNTTREPRVLPRLFHSVEGFLENFDIAGVAGLFARVLNPFLLQ
jgi:hypothetical protein